MEKHHLHWGLKKVIIGALLLLNAFVWPKWLGIDGWVEFFAVLMVLLGIAHFVFPHCCCCKAPAKKRK